MSVSYPADKTFWVPLVVESRYIVRQDRLSAASTFWGEHVVVVLATICPPFVLVEAFITEEVSALSAKEMLRMPGFIQSSNALLKQNHNAVLHNYDNTQAYIINIYRAVIASS